MKPPPYVSIFQETWIRVKGDVRKIPRLNALLGSIPHGYKGLLFDEGGNYFENISLIQALVSLNNLGVVFGEDHKQGYSPAEFMRELQQRRILKNDFISIFWTKPDKWDLRLNNAEPSA